MEDEKQKEETLSDKKMSAYQDTWYPEKDVKEKIQNAQRRIKEETEFIDTYPIWTKIQDNETKNKVGIPKEFYPILDSFWKMIREMLLKEQNKIFLEEFGRKLI